MEDIDTKTTQVGKIWRVPYRLPTLFVQREAIYERVFPYFSYQREVFGVALLPPEAIVFKSRNFTSTNSTAMGDRQKRFVSITLIILFWATFSALAAAAVSAGVAYHVTS